MEFRYASQFPHVAHSIHNVILPLVPKEGHNPPLCKELGACSQRKRLQVKAVHRDGDSHVEGACFFGRGLEPHLSPWSLIPITLDQLPVSVVLSAERDNLRTCWHDLCIKSRSPAMPCASFRLPLSCRAMFTGGWAHSQNEHPSQDASGASICHRAFQSHSKRKDCFFVSAPHLSLKNNLLCSGKEGEDDLT